MTKDADKEARINAAVEELIGRQEIRDSIDFGIATTANFLMKSAAVALCETHDEALDIARLISPKSIQMTRPSENHDLLNVIKDNYRLNFLRMGEIESDASAMGVSALALVDMRAAAETVTHLRVASKIRLRGDKIHPENHCQIRQDRICFISGHGLTQPLERVALSCFDALAILALASDNEHQRLTAGDDYKDIMMDMSASDAVHASIVSHLDVDKFRLANLDRPEVLSMVERAFCTIITPKADRMAEAAGRSIDNDHSTLACIRVQRAIRSLAVLIRDETVLGIIQRTVSTQRPSVFKMLMNIAGQAGDIAKRCRPMLEAEIHASIASKASD